MPVLLAIALEMYAPGVSCMAQPIVNLQYIADWGAGTSLWKSDDGREADTCNPVTMYTIHK
jgi:hypothetical protein